IVGIVLVGARFELDSAHDRRVAPYAQHGSPFFAVEATENSHQSAERAVAAGKMAGRQCPAPRTESHQRAADAMGRKNLAGEVKMFGICNDRSQYRALRTIGELEHSASELGG